MAITEKNTESKFEQISTKFRLYLESKYGVPLSTTHEEGAKLISKKNIDAKIKDITSSILLDMQHLGFSPDRKSSKLVKGLEKRIHEVVSLQKAREKLKQKGGLKKGLLAGLLDKFKVKKT